MLSSAALTVASRSSCVCAAETNIASNWLGARYTPRDNISLKYFAYFFVSLVLAAAKQSTGVSVKYGQSSEPIWLTCILTPCFAALSRRRPAI